MNNVDTILRNGKLYTPGGWFEGGLAIEAGKIVALGTNVNLPDAEEIIDCNGNFVIPGGIDAHYHANQPWDRKNPDGTDFPCPYLDTIESGTAAASMGGITTVGEHPFSYPWLVTGKLFKEKIKFWDGKAVVNYAFHGGVSNEGGHIHPDEIKDVWAAGSIGLKIFMLVSSAGYYGLNEDGQLFEAFEVCSEIDALPMIHAENEGIIASNKRKLGDRTDYQVHYESRTPFAEFEAVQRCVLFFKEAGSRGLLCHTSIPEGVREVHAARQEGFPIYLESCPHYLTMSTKDIDEKGPWAKCAPPVRDPVRVAEMWNLLNKGWIDTLGTDHVSPPKEKKELGLKNMWDSPNGLSGVEHVYPQMLNAVNEGRTTLEQVIKVLSENPAKIFRIYPQKGVLAVGSDADILIVDMNYEEKVVAENLITLCKWSPLKGKTLKGFPIRTLVRGKTVMADREVVGIPGDGTFVSRLV